MLLKDLSISSPKASSPIALTTLPSRPNCDTLYAKFADEFEKQYVSQGFDEVYSLTGGFVAWQQAQLPIEQG